MSARAHLAEMRRRRMRRLVLAHVVRWTPTRKATLCMALRGGVVTLAEASAAQGVPTSEIEGWLSAFRAGGHAALRVTVRATRARAT
jgi:hypothetical protein